MHLTIQDRAPLLPPDHRLFSACHASTLAILPSGERLAAFFAGTREGAGDNAIWLSQGHGDTWATPVRRFAEPGLAHWNPVLHAEGRSVWLFYKVGPTVHDWITRWTVSADGGATWTSPVALVPGDEAPRGPVKNKLIVLANGDWAAPASVETEPLWDCFVDLSSDAGRSWRRADIPIEHRTACADDGEIWQGLTDNALWETDLTRVMQWDGVIQPTLWERAPGQLHALMRSTRGHIWRSDSVDGGAHWRPAYATALPNNNSGIDVAHLGGGRLVLALNPVTGNWGRRTPIALVTSADNGATWSNPTVLEDAEGEFSYPAIITGPDALHVSYTSNRTNIVTHRVTVHD
jgi:predicted neuraminidase